MTALHQNVIRLYGIVAAFFKICFTLSIMQNIKLGFRMPVEQVFAIPSLALVSVFTA